jgi:hypothetical protein
VVRDRAGQPVAVGQVDDEQQLNADAGWLDSMHDPIARRRRPGLYPDVLGAIRVLIRKAGSAAEPEAGPPEVWSPARKSSRNSDRRVNMQNWLTDEQVISLAPSIAALATWLDFQRFAAKYFGPAAATLRVKVVDDADPRGTGEHWKRVARVQAFNGQQARLRPDISLPVFAAQADVWAGAGPDDFDEFMTDDVDGLTLPDYTWQKGPVIYEVDLRRRPEIGWAKVKAEAPSFPSALAVLRGYGDECGWTENTQFSVLADFVDELGLAPALQTFVAAHAIAEFELQAPEPDAPTGYSGDHGSYDPAGDCPGYVGEGAPA